jgi:hypothetical protein
VIIVLTCVSNCPNKYNSLASRFSCPCSTRGCKPRSRDVLRNHSLNKIQEQGQRERNTSATLRFVSNQYEARLKDKLTDLRSRVQSRSQKEEAVSCTVHPEQRASFVPLLRLNPPCQRASS